MLLFPFRCPVCGARFSVRLWGARSSSFVFCPFCGVHSRVPRSRVLARSVRVGARPGSSAPVQLSFSFT